MRRRNRSRLVAVTIALLASASAQAGEETAGVEAIEACLRANAPKRSSELEVTLESVHKGDGTSSHRGAIHWRRADDGRSETLVCLRHPPDVRGLAYLVLDDGDDVDLWGYLPEQKRVSQIHPRGAARRARIARTAIGFDDLRFLPGNTGGRVTTVRRDEVIEGRPTTVVELSPPPGGDVVYERIVSYVDRETCIPLRTELYETPEKMVKLVTVDPGSIERVGEVRLARSMTVEDLKNGVRTELFVERVELDRQLPDRMFAPNRLDRNVCGESR